MFKLSQSVGMMVLATIAFAGMNFCVKQIKELNVAEIVFFRSLVQILMGAITLWYLKISIVGKNPKLLIWRGVYGSIGLMCYFYTLQTMQLGNAVTIHYLAPIFTTFFAWVIANEKPKSAQWVFFGIMFLGIAIINGASDSLPPIPVIVAIFGAVFSALAYTTIKRLQGIENPNVVVLYFPLISVPITALHFLTFSETWILPNSGQLFWLILTGVFTQIGQFFMTRAYMFGNASKVSSITYLGAIWAAILGSLFFQEQYNIIQLCGIVLVILGILINFYISNHHKPLNSN